MSMLFFKEKAVVADKPGCIEAGGIPSFLWVPKLFGEPALWLTHIW